MIKLFSLEGFLNLSSDTVKKIESELNASDFDENRKFDDIDEFADAAVTAVDEGATVILAAENEEYNAVKKQLIDTFSLRKCRSNEILDTVFRSRKGFAAVQDLDGHCLMPLDAEIYVTKDGLYSGFCVEFSNGAKLILIPLDSLRLDDMLYSVKKELGIEKAVSDYNDASIPQDEISSETANDEAPEEEETDSESADTQPQSDEETEAFESEGDLEEESQAQEQDGEEASQASDEDGDGAEEESVVTLRNGEALIVDESDEADLSGFADAMGAAAKTAFSLINYDKNVAFIRSETSPYLLAMFDRVEGLSDTFSICTVDIDNEKDLDVQVALAKKTRLAINETGVDFAAAVSPVIKGEKDGKDIYYSYIVIHDGSSAKAKKVSTLTRQGVESLIPHAFSVMFGLVEKKAENMAILERDMPAEFDSDRKKKNIFLAVSVFAAVVAIASAFIMVWSYFQQTPEMLTTTDPLYNSSDSSTSSSSPAVSNSIPGNISNDPLYPYPAEPTASDVTNIPTSTPFSSTKGVFTFTVYGYGHGVGMSQTGANYYASIGKSYLEILSMYYYGATLVLGDTAPETVKFGNSTFTLRDYIATAVESEMGGSYNPEALKAQAVAIYTFAKYYNFDVPATLHAFNKTPTQASYDAVDVVIGQYMTYNGNVIKPYFHATSAGKTASYTNVFGDEQIPYLAGGRPSYGDVNVTDYCTTVTFTSDELNALIYSKTGKTLSGDPANWLKILSHDGCVNQNIGYISKIQVGDDVYSGYEFRMKVLGGALRSHCFTFSYTPTA